jgi:hypothetical protein
MTVFTQRFFIGFCSSGQGFAGIVNFLSVYGAGKFDRFLQNPCDISGWICGV